MSTIDVSNWHSDMARAYDLGLRHGQVARAAIGKPPGGYLASDLAGGFDASYFQGFGRGSGACLCPEVLAGKYRDRRLCVVCNNPRCP